MTTPKAPDCFKPSPQAKWICKWWNIGSQPGYWCQNPDHESLQCPTKGQRERSAYSPGDDGELG
jgi:hypothetical protein